MAKEKVKKTARAKASADENHGHAHHAHEQSETSDKARTRYSTVRDNADIGIDESWSANVKRTYDEFLDMSLVGARHQQQHFDALMARSQTHFDAQQNVLLQLMQNCVDTANLANKQGVAHRDLAIHHEFGAHEQVGPTQKR